MKNISLTLIMFLSLSILSKGLKAQTQDLLAVNAAGGYGEINGQLFDFNVGELVLVQTFDFNPYLLTQGFLQPFLLINPVVTDVTVANNVLTPNNDGKNDFFVVKGLENYPGSVIKIVDRAGRLVYTTSDYKNDWYGMVNGNPLAEDTYYYIINLGKGGIIKGFITIIREK